MRDELKKIVNEFERFKKYVDNLDLSIYEDCSVEELIEFKDVIYKNQSDRSIIIEAYKIIYEKKQRFYEEATDVRFFPILKEISFLTKKDKIKVDKFLGGLGMNRYFDAYSSQWISLLKSLEANNVEEELLSFLLDNDVIYKKYPVRLCCDEHFLTKDEITKLLKCIELAEQDDTWSEEYSYLENFISDYNYCDNCEEEIHIITCKDKIIKSINEPIRHGHFELKIPAKYKI